jgi:hypothetical protein
MPTQQNALVKDGIAFKRKASIMPSRHALDA